AAAREQVDGREQEGKESGDEGELDRPAADEPRAEVEVARRAARELQSAVQRLQQLLSRAAELSEPRRVESLGRVAERWRGAAARRRQGDGRDPVDEERRLLVEAERKAEVDQLADGARAAGALAGLLEDSFRRRLDEAARGRAGLVPSELEPGRPVAGE